MYQTRDLKQELKHFAVRFSQQIMAFVSMAVCTALGYQLHAASEHIRFDSLVASVFGHASTSVSVMFGMHPIVSLLLLPALFVGGCALGGLYLWNRSGQ